MPKRNLKPLPSQKVLRSILDYDVNTGEFRWKKRPASMFPSAPKALSWNKNFAGKVAFTVQNGNGYLCGYIFYQKVYAHRVAWKIVTGEEPTQIDHISGDRGDNRFSNLRAVTQAVNSLNLSRRSNNKSGVTGVHWAADIRKWHARINIYGSTILLGNYDSFDEAVAARKAAERVHNFHPNHGRSAV